MEYKYVEKSLKSVFLSQLVVERVLGPALAQGSTATGSLTQKGWPSKMGITTSTIIAKNGLTCKACMNIPVVRLCADRVRCLK